MWTIFIEDSSEKNAIDLRWNQSQTSLLLVIESNLKAGNCVIALNKWLWFDTEQFTVCPEFVSKTYKNRRLLVGARFATWKIQVSI